MKSSLVRSSGRIAPGRRLWVAAIVLVSCTALAAAAGAATIYANPGDNITSKVNTMSPGDTLILNPGSYSSTIRITNLNGDANHWFTIHGSDAGHVRIVATGNNNMIETRNSSFWKLENFEMDGVNGTGSDGIHVSQSSDYYKRLYARPHHGRHRAAPFQQCADQHEGHHLGT